MCSSGRSWQEQTWREKEPEGFPLKSESSLRKQRRRSEVSRVQSTSSRCFPSFLLGGNVRRLLLTTMAPSACGVPRRGLESKRRCCVALKGRRGVGDVPCHALHAWAGFLVGCWGHEESVRRSFVTAHILAERAHGSSESETARRAKDTCVFSLSVACMSNVFLLSQCS